MFLMKKPLSFCCVWTVELWLSVLSPGELTQKKDNGTRREFRKEPLKGTKAPALYMGVLVIFFTP